MSRRVWAVGGAFALLIPMLALAGCAGLADRGQCLANAMCAARLQEPHVLRDTNAMASRDGATLTLKPSAAKPMVMTDAEKACEVGDAAQCQGFALMGFVPEAHAFVLQKFHYEGSDFFLVDDRSGRQTKLGGMPTFSPDKTRFLVAPFDDESDTSPNNLEIWRRQDDGAVIEWAHPFKQASVEDPALPSLYQSRVLRWEDDRIALAFSTEGPQSRTWTGTLIHQTDGWHLSAKSPPGLFRAGQTGARP